MVGILMILLTILVFAMFGGLSALIYILISRQKGNRKVHEGFNKPQEYQPRHNSEVLNVRQQRSIDDKSAKDDFITR